MARSAFTDISNFKRLPQTLLKPNQTCLAHQFATSGACICLSPPLSTWAPIQVLMVCYKIISCMRTNNDACLCSLVNLKVKHSKASPVHQERRNLSPFHIFLNTQDLVSSLKDNINLLSGDKKLWLCTNYACSEIMKSVCPLQIFVHEKNI